MYCSNCGTQILDESNYCQTCGHPQKQNKPLSPVEYEICTLTFTAGGFWKPRAFWEAKSNNNLLGQSSPYNPTATSKSSLYNIVFGEDSSSIIRRINRLKLESNAQLVAQLASQGWEVLTTDKDGYVISMKKVKK